MEYLQMEDAEMPLEFAAVPCYQTFGSSVPADYAVVPPDYAVYWYF
jgi:hypothetical protein